LYAPLDAICTDALFPRFAVFAVYGKQKQMGGKRRESEGEKTREMEREKERERENKGVVEIEIRECRRSSKSTQLF